VGAETSCSDSVSSFSIAKAAGRQEPVPSSRHGPFLPPVVGASTGHLAGRVSGRAQDSWHPMLCCPSTVALGIRNLCISIFIPFTGMAGGCSSFSFSFFFFTFLGCRGDMLVTLVTVSPELQNRGTLCEGKVNAVEGKTICPSELIWTRHLRLWVPAEQAGFWPGDILKNLSQVGNALSLAFFQLYSLAEELGSLLGPGAENAKCQF